MGKELVPVGPGLTREMMRECTRCDEGLVRNNKQKPKVVAKQPEHRVEQSEEPDEDGEEWLTVTVELPGVTRKEEISAGLVHMKVLELETTQLKGQEFAY